MVHRPSPTSATPARKRILFVDDEEAVLEALRDALRPQRRVWEMSFVTSGPDALRLLEDQPQDVVVADLRMPMMDGATLLEQVSQRCPDAVRIVLSGHGELRMVARAAAVAHRMLSKPCDNAELTRLIESSCKIKEDAIDARGTNRLFGTSLPSVPQLYLALTNLLADEGATIRDAAELVEKDIGTAAKVLRLANSAYFGRRTPVSSILEAVAYLGLEQLRALVLHAEALNQFNIATPIPGFELERLQHHGTAVATIAKAITNDPCQRDYTFTAGLLHDIGLLVLASARPDELGELIDHAGRDARPLHELEHDTYGATHADIGGYVLALWGLPEPITDAVAHHHTSAPADVPPGPIAITRIATTIVEEIDGNAISPTLPVSRLTVTEATAPELAPLIARGRKLANDYFTSVIARDGIGVKHRHEGISETTAQVDRHQLSPLRKSGGSIGSVGKVRPEGPSATAC